MASLREYLVYLQAYAGKKQQDNDPVQQFIITASKNTHFPQYLELEGTQLPGPAPGVKNIILSVPYIDNLSTRMIWSPSFRGSIINILKQMVPNGIVHLNNLTFQGNVMWLGNREWSITIKPHNDAIHVIINSLTYASQIDVVFKGTSRDKDDPYVTTSLQRLLNVLNPAITVSQDSSGNFVIADQFYLQPDPETGELKSPLMQISRPQLT